MSVVFSLTFSFIHLTGSGGAAIIHVISPCECDVAMGSGSCMENVLVVRSLIHVQNSHGLLLPRPKAARSAVWNLPGLFENRFANLAEIV